MSSGGKDGEPLPILLTTEHGFLFYQFYVDQFTTVLSDPQIADLPVTVIGLTGIHNIYSNNLLDHFIPALQAMESGTELDRYDWSKHKGQAQHGFQTKTIAIPGETSKDRIWSRPFVVTVDGQRRVVVLVESSCHIGTRLWTFRLSLGSKRVPINLSCLLASTNILMNYQGQGMYGVEHTLESEMIAVKEGEDDFGFIEREDAEDDGNKGTTPQKHTVTWFVLPGQRQWTLQKRKIIKEFLDCAHQLLKRALKRTKTVDGTPLTCGQLAGCLQRLAALFQQRRHPTRDELRETLAARSGDALIKWAIRCAVQRYEERFLETESEAKQLERDPRWRAEATYHVLDQTRDTDAATVDLMEQANRAFNEVQQRQAQATEQSVQQEEQPTKITEETAAQMFEENVETVIAKLEAEKALPEQQRDHDRA